MAKRVIQQCDLCKSEYDPDDTHVISVKKKGKQKGNVFDLCPECAEKIQQQLVAKSSDSLTDWGFVGTPDQSFLRQRPVAESPRGSTRATQEAAILAQQEDNDLINRKTAERKVALAEAGRPEEEQEEAREVPYETVEPTPRADGSCTHMNKSRIHTVGEQFVQECRDCGETLEPNTSSNRASYMGTRAGKGVTLSSHASDKRNRN